MRVPLLQLFLRVIPETIISVFGAYMYALKPIDKTKAIISGALIGIISYLVRMLPIVFGVYTFLILLSMVLVFNLINDISVMKAVPYTLLWILICSLFEFINDIMIVFVFKIDLEKVMNDPMKKVLYGSPSFVLLTITALFSYKFLYKPNFEKVQQLKKE